MASKTVEKYLEDLEKVKKEKPDQVKEGLELYVDLWRKAIAAGVISSADEVDAALEKLEEKGGLYQAAEG
ncbi:MAG: hypothetical protein HY296_07090 [Thaumarchaeota archaeon]|nr:hypothetical protein [Nitrososphaerota archaeon]